MKKLVFLFSLIASISAYAQCGSGCTISGPSSIVSGSNRTFSTVASSGFSYFWSTTGGISIIGANTGSSVTVRGSSGGSVYVTKFRAGSAPCCASRTVGVVPPPPTCGLSVTNVGHLNVLGNSSVTLVANSSLQSGWSYSSIVFTVTYESGTTSNFTGSVNPSTGLPQASISLTCTSSNTRARRIEVRITARSGSNSCTRTSSRNYSPALCGSSGGIGRSSSLTTILKNTAGTLDVYSISGEPKLSNIDIDKSDLLDELNNGIYIIKYQDKNGDNQTKKIFIE